MIRFNQSHRNKRLALHYPSIHPDLKKYPGLMIQMLKFHKTLLDQGCWECQILCFPRYLCLLWVVRLDLYCLNISNGVCKETEYVEQMPMDITALKNGPPNFGAIVTGLDIVNVSDNDVQALEVAIDRYAVLIFPDQNVTDEQQYAFSSKFGTMEKATGDINQNSDRRLAMDINDISNLDKSGAILARNDRARLFGLGNMLWHSDSSFKTIPAKYSLLSARVIPDFGGNTEFADMRAAWSELDTEMQSECMDLVCVHSQLYSRGALGFEDFTEEEKLKWAPVKQPLVRQHPSTKLHSLFLSSHIGTIEGWPVPEARLLIRDLTEHATKPEFVFSHQWKRRDLVLWDNRVTMHRARRYDHTQKRDLRRTTVAGDARLLSA